MILAAAALIGCVTPRAQQQSPIVRVVSPSPTVTPTPVVTPAPTVVPPATRTPPPQTPNRAVTAPAARAPSHWLEAEIINVFGPAYGPGAVRRARCESVNFTPAVVYGPRTGSAGERGVFQAHPGHWDGRWGGPARTRVHGYTFDEMFDPAKNIRWAHAHSRAGRDWSQWTCA